MARCTVVLLTVCCVRLASTQDLPSRPQFDKITIHRDRPLSGEWPAGQVDYFPGDTTLAAVVAFAFNVPEYRIVGGPSWVRSTAYGVYGKAPATATASDRKPMVQSLLSDRFRLRVHMDRRDIPVYELVRANTSGELGPNVVPSTYDCRAFRGPGASIENAPTASDGMPRCAERFLIIDGVKSSSYTISLFDTPLSTFVSRLEDLVRRTVVDRTQLNGNFDVRFKYEADGRKRAASIRAELEERLGLRLRDSRDNVEVLVIDSAERPTLDR